MEKPSSMSSKAEMIERKLDNAFQTRALAEKLADLLQIGDAILLRGPLGAGKSTLARALVRKLTSPDEEAPSPTFTLVQSYPTRAGFDLYHFDLYRLSDPDEAYELGLDEALSDGVALIEWPERLEDRLPPNRLDIELSVPTSALLAIDCEDEPRLARITAFGTWKMRIGELAHD